ncbi:hypothetical protein ACIP5N_22270 [Streptomyces sp. NPDC088768]|uniref:hypothetical protein n=1 Tax=Streptomyces sp. NPDC088768 TaxID=3365894 RepID=UPI0038079A85
MWVQRQQWPDGARQETRSRQVVFAGAEGPRPHGPRWRAVTHGQLEDLVGAEVSTDC